MPTLTATGQGPNGEDVELFVDDQTTELKSVNVMGENPSRDRSVPTPERDFLDRLRTAAAALLP